VTIGVLALQGDYEAHLKVLAACGVEARPVRTAEQLRAVDGLVIPGGESTVMSRLCDRYGLWEPLQEMVLQGVPMLGTCAGMIFLAQDIEGGASTFTQRTLGALDITVARNAYGAQLDSFETDLEVPVTGGDIRAVFIRAPKIVRLGEGIEVLATYADAPVLVRQGNLVAASFHPEIAGEFRVHRLWLDGIHAASVTGGEK